MGQLSIIERACAFCCGVMAEMGNLLEMSYQKVNVILFCWVEPGICLLLWFAFAWRYLHLPGSKVLSWISMGASSIAISVTAILLIMAAVFLVRDLQNGLDDPTSIFNMTEPNSLFVIWYNETVVDLTKIAGALHISYSAVNILYYVLLLPVLIVAGYYEILKDMI